MPVELARIAVLPPALADQIAAGEVVERPGSIVKELVENAIDAGATRIEVELEAGGVERIRVIDDGVGIVRDDLLLAVTRHATSKLHAPEQLIEIHTLGFRGEALASIAAVARLELRSRVAGEIVGHRLAVVPGRKPTLEPIGMPQGTSVEVAQLFANVPARRKFLRSEATEVGHCVDAVVRAALVHPRVQFRVRHHGRELLELPASDQTSRVIAVLQRRGGSGPFVQFELERGGTNVMGWFAPPSAATKERSASFVVVRRRVVSERTLAAVLKQVYGDRLASGKHPVACLFVDPPTGTVDVNVHPQKSEVRFANPQSVYAIVRELVEQGLAAAPWRTDGELAADAPGESAHEWAQPGAGAREALASWSRRDALREPAPERHAGEGRTGYRLGTRAASDDYRAQSVGFRDEVERLRSSLTDVRRDIDRRWTTTEPLFEHEPPQPPREATREVVREVVPEPRDETGPALLTCLPGPVAVFELDGELLVADLRRVRAQLVRRRLLTELAALGPGQRAPAQGLLVPVVVPRAASERAALLAGGEALASLGLELDGFGDDAVLVRAVPAVLPKLLDAAAIGSLLDRLLPWLRLQAQGVADRTAYVDAIAEIAGGQAIDTSPRLARRWLAELLADGTPVDAIDGLRRWSAPALLGSA
jgi:DNA mismatch repair protein MutL